MLAPDLDLSVDTFLIYVGRMRKLASKGSRSVLAMWLATDLGRTTKQGRCPSTSTQGGTRFLLTERRNHIDRRPHGREEVEATGEATFEGHKLPARSAGLPEVDAFRVVDSLESSYCGATSSDDDVREVDDRFGASGKRGAQTLASKRSRRRSISPRTLKSSVMHTCRRLMTHRWKRVRSS